MFGRNRKLAVENGLDLTAATAEQPAKPTSSDEKKMQKAKGLNRYVESRLTDHDRYMNLATEKRNAEIRERIMAALLAISIAFNGYSASQNKFVPYVVALDKIGHVIAVGPASEANPIDDKRVIRQAVIDWVMDARTVIGDMGYQKKIMRRVYARVMDDSKAKKGLDTFYLDRKPFVMAQTQTVDAEVTLALQVGNTWEVEWTETFKALNGNVIGKERWKGRFTMLMQPQQTEEGITRNSLGLFFSDFSWTKQI